MDVAFKALGMEEIALSVRKSFLSWKENLENQKKKKTTSKL